MRRELEHFIIDGSYGWNQDWFPDFFMRMGGYAAVTACDSCVYFALRMGHENLIPFSPDHITRANYLILSRHMKRVLGPRMRGVDKLEIYQDGLGAYFQEVHENQISIGAWHGEKSYLSAQERLIAQINAGLPVPFLLLQHADPAFDFYTWHWFLLMGYNIPDNPDASDNSDNSNNPGAFQVQAVTYGHRRWLDFQALWNTGFDEKGGMILFHLVK